MQETPIISGSYRYKAPSKTIVQVSGTLRKPVLTEKLIKVPRNSRSVLKIDFYGISPFLEMKVKLVLNSACEGKLTILDSELVADKDTTVLYTILESNSTETVCTIKYTLDGESASAFIPLNDTRISIEGTEQENPDNSTSFIVETTKGELGINANASAIVYWVLLSTKLFSSNSTLYELEYIKNNSEPLYGDRDYSKSLYSQLIGLEVMIAAVQSQNWGTSCLNTLKAADSTMIYGTSYVPESSSGSSAFYKLGNLIASTDYTLVTYIESMSKIVNFSFKSAKTASYDSSVLIVVKLEQKIPIDKIIQAVALSINVNSNRIISYDVPQQRRLIESNELILLPSMRSSVSNLETAKRLAPREFLASFNELYPNETLSDVTVTVGSDGIDENDYGKPVFSSFNWNSLPDGVSANFSLNQVAEVCCVVSEDDADISGASIKYGYDESGTDYIWVDCVMVPEGKIRNLTFYSSNYSYPLYFMKCIPCNLYPIIPLCIRDQLRNTTFGSQNAVSFSILFGTFKGILIWTLLS